MWLLAYEYRRALDPLARAASLTPDGKLYVRLATLQAQLEEWSGVVDSIRLAFDKGELERPGQAQLLLGIALYSQGKPAEARPWFERAATSSDARKEASAWLEQFDREAREARPASSAPL